MDINGVKEVADQLSIKGLGLGVAVGIILEVFLIRSGNKVFNFFLTVSSILSIGLMGWISFDIANASLPLSAWKPEVFAIAISFQTWWIAKLALSGQMAKLILTTIMPDSLKRTRRYEDEH